MSKTDDDVLAGIEAATNAASTPRLVYTGPLDGPGSIDVLVYDCPVVRGEGFVDGALFAVVARPKDGCVTMQTAAEHADGTRHASMILNADYLGVSNTSVDDALADARSRHSS